MCSEMTDWFNGFEAGRLELASSTVNYRLGGHPHQPPLVLLHGFPQTHVMWHRVVRRLAASHRILIPDLRGYGDSFAHQPDALDHAPHSKRAMAADIVALMDHVGMKQVFLCGHDRGGRVAHRLAIDHPERVRKLCVIDIAPTLDMYARTDMDFARAYYHWFHLIQPAPLPETMIGNAAMDYLATKLGGWGGQGLDHLEPQALLEYQRCFCRPEAIHSACEDYRASAGIDLEHDTASRVRGEKIACDTLVLWGDRGVVHRLFRPLELWQAQCAGHVSGEAMPAGHFIPEELPDETAAALKRFFV